MDGLLGAPGELASSLAAAPMTLLSSRFVSAYIPLCALAGLLFALYQISRVAGIRVHSSLDEDTEALLGPARDHDGARRDELSTMLRRLLTPSRYRQGGLYHSRRHQGRRSVVSSNRISRHPQLLPSGACPRSVFLRFQCVALTETRRRSFRSSSSCCSAPATRSRGSGSTTRTACCARRR